MPKNTFVDNLPNDDYHQPEMGLSNSVFKLFMENPSLVVWNNNAKKDPEKIKVLDFGTDFHTYFLEPDEFKKYWKVLPEFNRRKPAEKQAELDMIEEWSKLGVNPVTKEDMHKLDQMRQSAYAHPVVAELMALPGVSERSFFWTDPETGLQMKCRPDRLIEGITDDNRPNNMPANCKTIVLDVKTIGQFSRMQNQIEDLQYYIQDRFYSRGIAAVTGCDIDEIWFVFMFVSTSLEIGRYPVKVIQMSESAKLDADNMIAENLPKYAAYKNSPDSAWNTVITLDRPHWAQQDDIL